MMDDMNKLDKFDDGVYSLDINGIKQMDDSKFMIFK